MISRRSPKRLAQGDEALGVLHGGHGIVHRAGADDDGEAVVLAVQDIVRRRGGRRARCLRRGVGARVLAHDLDGRGQFADLFR